MEFSANIVLLAMLAACSLTEGAVRTIRSRGDTIPPGQTDASQPDGGLTTGTDADGNCVYSFHVPIEAINLRPCPGGSDSRELAQLRADMAAQSTAANTRITDLAAMVELLQESLAAQQRHIEALQRTAEQGASSSPNHIPGVIRPYRLFGR
ncbi:uncharacterized protein [Branchiostoma lanceolatum]|uniref:uncharacterized protein n=1 Tax=Branchiostoma lanceolatum TaxID=7740 RepID=UPI003455B808